MKKNLFLLIGVIVLYLAPALTLKAIYGESYQMWQDDNEWVADGNNGWTKHGTPTEEMPENPSVNIPIVLQYIPIFLPALLLILFMFTPLSRKMESPPEPEEDEETEENI